MMSSKFLDIPGRKQTQTSVSSDDDDHSFIILGSPDLFSLSDDNGVEVLPSSPIMEIASESNDTDIEQLINSELDNENEFHSLPEMCKSLIARIKPGMIITAEDNYMYVLKEIVEEIFMKFEQMKGMKIICIAV